MEHILSRALTTFPQVNQSDLLLLMDSLSSLTAKEHSKLVKSVLKTLPSTSHQSRLDIDSFRLERSAVVPCKTTIETFKLSNPHKTAIQWKLLKPSNITPQHFISCTPSSGTLPKGKSVLVRVCSVAYTFKSILEMLMITCSAQGNPHNAYIPILLKIEPDTLAEKPPYWSVDLSELELLSGATLLPSNNNGASNGSSCSNNDNSIRNPKSSSLSSLPSHEYSLSSPSVSPAGSPRNDAPLSSSDIDHPKTPVDSELEIKSQSSNGIVMFSFSIADLYGTKVAVKKWNIGTTESPPEDCLEEIRILQSLSHPNLLGFIGARAELGQSYVITKHLENGPLDQFLKSPKANQTSKGELPNILKRIDLLLDAAYGVAYIHGKNFVHGNLSTSIMILDEVGRVKLADFGQSRMVKQSANSKSANRYSTTLRPSCYTAPESVKLPDYHSKIGISHARNPYFDSLQCFECAEPTMATDVFSFGICLWEIACNTRPTRSSSDIISGTVPPLTCDLVLLPDYIELINECCNPDPSQRPSFSTIVTELEGIRDTAKSRTLTHFALGRNKTLKDRNIPSLPRSLVFLDMASNVHITDQSIIELPRQLAHLDLSLNSNLSDDCIIHLPPSLTYLDLSSNTKLTDKSIKFLPRGLVFLSLRDNTNLTELALLDLPPMVATLNIMNSFKLGDPSQGGTSISDCLKRLPTTITDLNMPFHWIANFPNENVTSLPPTLTTFNMATNMTLTDKGLQYLPSSLRHINLSANRKIEDAALACLPPFLETLVLANAENISDDGIQHLPRTLQHLNLSSNKKIGYMGVKVLPPGLLSLNLSSTQKICDISVKYFPRSLTSLILTGNKQLTDQSIRDLPPSLTELNLSSNRLLTDSCVKMLPASLKYLNLYWNTNLTDACIRFLPRSLTDLNLSSNENMTDASVPDLPRSLKYLYLGKASQLSDSCIKYLPRSLTHLDISSAHHLTDECVSDMPTSLITLELWKNKNLSQEKLRARLPSMRVLALNVE